MMRRLTAFFAAAAFALATMAPAAADARDGRRHGYYDRGHHARDYDHRRYDHRRHRRNDDGAAVAAGVVGLVLGLAIASAASQPRQAPAPRCRDNYRSCPPPPGYGYNQPAPSYYDGGAPPAQPYYDDGYGSAYEDDYGAYAPPPRQTQCMRAERQWDRYANRYVTVDVPC